MLAVSILTFLFGEGPESIRPDGLNLTARIDNPDNFGTVFATCFPAFTGMIAGLGLSRGSEESSEKYPSRHNRGNIHRHGDICPYCCQVGSECCTCGVDNDQFIMARIALWGPAIYIGLGAAALSSALGSIMVAPRTLQMLAAITFSLFRD